MTSAATRGDIQGMRALAVLLVVAAHAGVGALAGGYIGVDVFFVISGFLITGILARSLRAEGRIGFADFYARRALRILPVASFVLVVISIASAFVYTSGRLHQVLGDSIWAGLFGLNIRYATSDTSYFARDDFVSPIQHYWSLAVEEQFYLFWPLIVAGGIALARAVMRRRLGPVADLRMRVVGLRYAGLAVGLLCIASLAWSWHRTGEDPLTAYFSTFTRAFELGAGAMLALIAPWVQRRSAVAKAVCSWLGLGGIVLAALLFDDGTTFPGIAALLPVLATVLLIAGGIEGSRYGAGWLLDRAPLRRIGDISFSFYLWHWPLLILPAAYLGRALEPSESAAAVLVALTLAALSYRYVEQPFRGFKLRDGYRLRALVMWPVALSLVLGTSGAVWAQQNWRDGQQDGYVRPDVDPEPTTEQVSTDELVNDVSFAGELARANYPLPDGLVPPLPDLINDITLATGYQNNDMACVATQDQITSQLCRTGDHSARGGVIVVLGDSHMGMWLAPITQLAQERGMTVIPLLKQRCLPFDVLMFNGEREPYTECLAHGRWALRQLRALKPDLVVMSALYQVSLVDPETGRQAERENDDALLAAGVRRTLTELREVAPRVLIIGPTPTLDQQAADCLGSTRAHSGTCRTEVDAPRVADRDRLMARLSKEMKVRYLSLLPWMCDEKGTCPVVVRNRIVYRDNNHITETYAERLKPVFERALRLGQFAKD